MEDFKKYLKPKVKIPVLKQPPELKKFEYLVRTTKLYKVGAEHQKKIVRGLEEKATRAKIRIAKQPLASSTSEDCAWLNSETDEKYYVDILRKCADKLITPPMLKECEDKIMSLISKQLRNKFPESFQWLMDDAKEDWYKNLHELGVKSIIREVPGIERVRYVEKDYKFKGKTDNHQKYLKTRAQVALELPSSISFNSFMQLVNRTSWTDLPNYIGDILSYRNKGVLRFGMLSTLIFEDLRSINTDIVYKWYAQLGQWLQETNCLDSYNVTEKVKFIKSSTRFIGMIIREMIKRSLDRLIECVSDSDKIPMVEMRLVYTDEQFVLRPSFDDIIKLFTTMAYKMSYEIAQNLKPIEYFLKVPSDLTELPINFSNEIYEEYLELLKIYLHKHFDSVWKFIESVKEKFSIICGEGANDYIRHFATSGHTFDELRIMIENLKAMRRSVARIGKFEYLNVGIINTTDMKEGLLISASEHIETILSSMCEQHKQINKDICAEFENIAQKALAIPETAGELVEQGEYCTHVRQTLLEQLRDRISDSFNLLTKLMDVTSIAPDHVELNTQTANWLNDLPSILGNNTLEFENYKEILEGNLLINTKKTKNALNNLLPHVELLNDMDDINRTFEYLDFIREFIRRLNQYDKEIKWINEGESSFKFGLSVFPELAEIKLHINPFYNLMYLAHKWRRSYYKWMDGVFEYHDRLLIEQEHEEYYKEFTKLNRQHKMKIKQQIDDDVNIRFSGLVDDTDVRNIPAPMKICSQALTEIVNWRPNVQLCSIMCNPALEQRHWDQMSEIAGIDLTPNAGTTIRKMIEMDLWDNLNEYEIISMGATKELALNNALKKMMDEWKGVSFKTSPFKDTGINILSGLDDIQALLDDHILKTVGMRGSAFVKPFEAEVKAWYEKVHRVNSSIDEWSKLQSQWLYLLPIFSSKDIVAQLPEEGAMFIEVDNTYKKYMEAVKRDPSVLQTAGTFGLLEEMQEAIRLLDKINDGVTDYLEKKRLYFPRFFFLSNDEMLEILSETKNPLKVQPHLKKCFEGISKLHFDNSLNILKMISPEGEIVDFLLVISTEEARGSVEKWLVQVEEQMILAVKSETELAFYDYPLINREKWVQNWEGMVVLCVSQIYWAMDLTTRLEAHNLLLLEEYHVFLTTQLTQLVTLVRSPKLTNIARISIKALIVIDVHAKDVVKELIDKNVIEVTDFQWLAQLRYYWENDDCAVKIINAVVKYAYEYLGNSDRLVITPLTDRCYRTLIGAYYLHLNGAPEGPAGTGKTETTKDLAKALAVQCVVFNCSDGLDYKAMGKFFKGLASAGAWACFDEFNRIDVEVLSVIAQQILCIVQAVRQKSETFIFEGTELKLNPACYVCITMNPGYAGRSELPDNLKVLFRTVAMMVPDYAMIGEISLYSFGFVNARNLSVKIVTTYRLCSEQLSSQNHYDYGMRAVKTVLQAAGNNKRSFPNEDESILLLRSIIDVNLAKFLSFDVPLFEGIISDLFPGIILPKPDYSMLINAANDVCKDLNLQPSDSVILKIIQTYDMMIVRHGFMLVGDPFSGKSSTLSILGKSLSLMNSRGQGQKNCRYRVLNPKAVTMGQLYGAFDPISYEWTDGIVATAFREFAMDETQDRKWIVFDGPVDAVWIENMNTVLDDNKKLCLTSGEVMSMSNTMSMIFEVMDLSQASPATVSRCGMIYMESVTLGYKPFCLSWTKSSNVSWCQGQEKFVIDLCDWLFPPLLFFVRRECTQLVFGGEINLVITTLKLIEMLINDALKWEDDLRYLKTWIQAAFMFSMIWGVGGILDTDSRIKFDEYCKQFWRGYYSVPETFIIEVSVPLEDNICDSFYLYKGKGCWKSWNNALKSEKTLETISLQQTVIPTMETLKYMYLLDMHIEHLNPFLISGPTGTGKSFYIQNRIMTNLSMEKYEPIFITFTTTTSANQAQNLIISKLFKRKRGYYGPPKGKIAVIFVDDMNMPAKEIYGAQPAIEVLRLYFDHKYWYDLKDTSQLHILDTYILGAIGPPGGSRQLIYQRLLRHFSIFSINAFNEESLTKIFSSILLLGLEKNGFGSDIRPIVNGIVAGTMEVYQTASLQLLPTPAKSHYVFNLRDFSRVIQGCGLIKSETANDKKVMIKLWIHEVLRVFYDRLIDDDDRNMLFSVLKSCTKTHLKESLDSAMDIYLDTKKREVTKETAKNMMFGTYLDLDAEEEYRKYQELPDINDLRDIATATLVENNNNNKTKLNIVLFDYALEHLSKICRLMAIPSGSGLLVGVGGSGRQSLVRLGSLISGQHLFQPEVTKTYSVKDWQDDLKAVLKESGGLGRNTIFLFTESQITDEIYIQNLDSLLNSGEVPNLYAIEDKQEILEVVRLAAQGGNRNLDISPLQVFAFFTSRCKEKLHIMLCFSPIGNSFRARLRLYPSLVNCCTIDWFDNWPEDALERVATFYMSDVNLVDNIKTSVVVACKQFQIDATNLTSRFFLQCGRKTYVTSTSYLNLIKLFTTLITKKQNELLEKRLRYTNGLDKLRFAALAVGQMQVELNALKPELILMAEKSAKMMVDIKKESIEADKTAAQVREDQKVANVQAAAAQELKSECEADLALALPVLNEAIGALNTLKPADITLVKSMKNPPAPVKLAMAAVCVMKGIPPDRIPDPDNPGQKIWDYWGPSKRLLGDIYFLQNLKDFDRDNISPAVMLKIRREFLPHPDFKPQIIAKASAAAEGLCKWVIAIDMYDAVVKVVQPKKDKLEGAERQLAETMSILNEKMALVESLEKKVRDLNQALQEANAKKKALEESVENCINKLQRAEKLIGGLGGENSRWNTAADDLQLLYDNLSGDVLISSGIIAYLSPYTLPYRVSILEKWRGLVLNMKMPISSDFHFSKVLGVEIKIQNWNIAGLPRDQFSSDNAIVQDNSLKWSLLIDPQGQANKWIKTMEKFNDLQVLKFIDSNYMKIIETSLEYGKPVLIENILEDVETPLDPILNKNTFIQGGKEFIALGDNVLEYSKNFRLYMTTKLRNPHYLPEIFNKMTIINFSLTQDGLEDQLLGIVVAKERPDLQEKREMLIVEDAHNKTTLRDVEDKILMVLQGDILEDESAVRILDSSKVLSIDIMKKQDLARDTEKMIDEFRLGYTPIASHSAVLYYCITELPNVDPMYQYSLAWFINLYVLTIETANKSKDLSKRLGYLRDGFTYNLYTNVCRSLFEKDKMMFSFILCTKIMLASGEINVAEYKFLLTGGISVQNPFENTLKWLSDKSWDEICRLSDLSSFSNLKGSLPEKSIEWEYFYDAAEPHAMSIPVPWQTLLSVFQKLLIVRALRPDKLTTAISLFVEGHMGKKFITPPPFDIGKSYLDSNCLSPLIFILSPGADPMGALYKFCEKMGYASKFSFISLGQGQGPIAQSMIAKAQIEGHWICLQNCHLAVSWLPMLEKIVNRLDPVNTDLSFRMWLTSYPSTQFPESILQNGVKMTNEPPTGLQHSLHRSYMSEPVNEKEFYEGCPDKDQAFAKLLYGICFFHALVQERKKFGPLGWNIQYGFNDSDFQISVMQLQIFINQYEEIQYIAIKYLTGECNYGGRVTDDWDRRLIVTLLEDFVNSNVVYDKNFMFSYMGPSYGLPNRHSYRDYLKHIEIVPINPPPEVYGLHMNAGITRDYAASMAMMDALLLVEGGGSSSEGENSDDILNSLTADILSKLPETFDVEIVSKKYPVDYNESMNTVLVQEMERYNKLIVEVKKSLQDMKKAVKGLIVMSPSLEMVANAMILGRIPESWTKVSYPSLKPLSSYILDLIERLMVLQDWYEHGKPSCFWLSGFFFTQAFLTGGMQNYARHEKIPIDLLTFDFTVMNINHHEKPPPQGVFVYGLFIDGARWNRQLQVIGEQFPKILNDSLPLVWFFPIVKNTFVEGTRYKCPLYKTVERKGILATTGHSSNYVLPIMLPSDKPSAHWIKRSVALLLQLND